MCFSPKPLPIQKLYMLPRESLLLSAVRTHTGAAPEVEEKVIGLACLHVQRYRVIVSGRNWRLVGPDAISVCRHGNFNL